MTIAKSDEFLRVEVKEPAIAIRIDKRKPYPMLVIAADKGMDFTIMTANGMYGGGANEKRM